jgi:hypothetical protein
MSAAGYRVHLRRGKAVHAVDVEWLPRRVRATVPITRAQVDDSTGEARRAVERVEVREYPEAAVAYVEVLGGDPV